MSAEEALHCDFPECGFTAVSKAGLVNHKRQKHAQRQPVQCQFSSKYFRQQGCTIINASVLTDLVELDFLACTTP